MYEAVRLQTVLFNISQIIFDMLSQTKDHLKEPFLSDSNVLYPSAVDQSAFEQSRTIYQDVICFPF